jgi:hypothetical protein
MDLSNHIKVPTQLFMDAINFKIINNDDRNDIFLNLKNDIKSYKSVTIVPYFKNNIIEYFWTSVFTPRWNNDTFSEIRKQKQIFPISDMIIDAGILPADKRDSYEFSTFDHSSLTYSISELCYIDRGKCVIFLLSKIIHLSEFKNDIRNSTDLNDLVISCCQAVIQIQNMLNDCDIYIPNKYNNIEKEIKIYTNAYNRGIHISVYKKHLKMLEEIEDIGCSPPIINIPVLQNGGYFYRESKEEFNILQLL